MGENHRVGWLPTGLVIGASAGWVPGWLRGGELAGRLPRLRGEGGERADGERALR